MKTKRAIACLVFGALLMSAPGCRLFTDRDSAIEKPNACEAAYPNRYSLGDARIPQSILDDGKKNPQGPMTPAEAKERGLPCYAPGPHNYAFDPTAWCCQ